MNVGMFQGRKIRVTGGKGYFGHKLRNELKNMGAVVVLFDTDDAAAATTRTIFPVMNTTWAVVKIRPEKKKFRAVRDFNRYRRGHGFKSRTSLKKFRPVREDRFHIHVSQFKYMTYIYSLTFIHHFTDLFRTTMKTWKNLSLRPCLFHYCSSTVRYCEDRFNIHVSQFKYMTFI